MLERTKKRHTKIVKLCIPGGMHCHMRPSNCRAYACLALGTGRVSQRQLAEMTGIPQRHISEMENGKRVIGKDRAKVLAKALIIG